MNKFILFFRQGNLRGLSNGFSRNGAILFSIMLKPLPSASVSGLSQVGLDFAGVAPAVLVGAFLEDALDPGR